MGNHSLDESGQISESTILRFDGTAWSAVPSTFNLLAQLWLTGLSGSSASDIYAVGEGFDESGGSSFGAILHFDGKSWSMVSGPPLPPQLEGGLYTVSSSSPNEAYAVGGARSNPLKAVWGTSAADVFAVGDSAPFFTSMGLRSVA